LGKEKGVLGEEKGALGSENDNYFGTKFECYKVKYLRQRECINFLTIQVTLSI
jgi:hypothetical protein